MAKAWVSYILHSIADTRMSESTKSLLHILAGFKPSFAFILQGEIYIILSRFVHVYTAVARFCAKSHLIWRHADYCAGLFVV